MAIAITIGMQYLFLAKLWEGYPIRWMGDLIHRNVVLSMIGLTVAGAIAIAAASLRRWRRGESAAAKLERPATNPSFDEIRSALLGIAGRSTLPTPPALLYTPKNADALEARERGKPTGDVVVVGLDQEHASAIDRTPSKRCWGTRSLTWSSPRRGSKSAPGAPSCCTFGSWRGASRYSASS
ncbi:hypothetical protein [Bradyrhizobium sp. BRP22]|uniref:hypothetical protein n=1 Tax=Bradyrhizobium sp. BRP22 TaxID=2793821 RepID=UPI001CD3A51E|nr:hypothetical protein [Bradyrhizobium sp. BRP22]